MSNYADKTGQAAMQKAPQLRLPTIQLQGADPKRDSPADKAGVRAGEFKVVHTEADIGKDEQYPVEKLGTSLDVIILKIRRKLSWYRKEGGKASIVQTNEHNTKFDGVMLYGLDGGTKMGRADDIRKEVPQLRTQQILYVYVPSKVAGTAGIVARLVVKGSSLGSQTKADNVTGFYDYLGKVNESKKHIHTIFTKISGVAESDYFTIDFQQGAALTDAQVKKVETQIDEVHDFTTSSDSFYKERIASQLPVPASVETELPVIESEEYPQEEISPDDIPF